MDDRRGIYCCGCNGEVAAHLVTGREVYPHRPDLYKLPFWQCPTCNNFVGCHHKTGTPTEPLGIIPTPEIKQARQAVHRALDPLWQGGMFPRWRVYRELSRKIGKQYHTADIRSVAEAEEILSYLKYARKYGNFPA